MYRYKDKLLSRMHTYTNKYICTFKYIHMHIYICTSIHIYRYTYIHLYIYTSIHLYIRVYRTSSDMSIPGGFDKKWSITPEVQPLNLKP